MKAEVSSHERDRECGVDPPQTEQGGREIPSPDCRECGTERNRSNRAFLDLRCVWATAACGFVLQPLGKTDLCLREAQGTDAKGYSQSLDGDQRRSASRANQE